MKAPNIEQISANEDNQLARINGFALAAFCACFPVTFGVAGCGGNSSNASAANNPAALAAKVQTAPSSILLTWALPTLPTGANVIEYNLYRDGNVIATPSASVTSYTDLSTAVATSVTYTSVPSSPGTTPSSATATVTPVTTGAAHKYALSIVYLYSANGIPEYYEVNVGTSASVILPAS